MTHVRLFHDAEDGRALAQAIVDTVREPLLVLDEDLRVAAASRSFYMTFQVSRQHTQGHLVYALGDGQWDIPALRELLEKIVPNRAVLDGYEVDHVFPIIGRRIMLLNARKVFYEDNSHTTLLLAFEDVTERRRTEQAVQDLLRQKELLVEEMQHRVANSLQIIASILLLKAGTVQSEETRQHLKDAHKRVISVAAVQQHLQATGRGEKIEIGPYLTKLCATLAQSMISDARPIELKVIADAGSMQSSEAVSVGLIVTEGVLNAIKHAFPDEQEERQIFVSYANSTSGWSVSVADNGLSSSLALPDDAKPGLGTSIVKALAHQLSSVVETARSSNGTIVSVVHKTPAPALAVAT
jgi:two-component sensor histidine kinase